MNQKYERPIARDLGQIQSAEGWCVAGSQAHDPTKGSCSVGLLAIGQYCGVGGTPNPDPALGCSTGSVPGFNGCGVGHSNASTCALGSSPL